MTQIPDQLTESQAPGFLTDEQARYWVDGWNACRDRMVDDLDLGHTVDAQKSSVDVGPNSPRHQGRYALGTLLTVTEDRRLTISLTHSTMNFADIWSGSPVVIFLEGDGDAKLSSSADLSEQRYEP